MVLPSRLALALLLVFAAAAVSAWAGQEPCGIGQLESEQTCSPLCITCVCCARPRVALQALALMPPPTAALSFDTVSPSRLVASPRKIPHVPKAALAG
jgi:hypothetical protein